MSGPELTFDAETHTYRVDGERVPSITQIMGAVGFYAGLEDAPQDKVRHAANRGSLVHLLCHAHDTGTELVTADLPQDLLAEAQPYFDAYRSWRESTAWRLIESENPRYCPGLGYAGTPDRIFHDGLSPVVVDIKTSWKVGAEAHIQTAAQDLLRGEAVDDRPRRLILHLTRAGDYREYESKDEHDYAIWHAALDLYKFLAYHKLLRRRKAPPVQPPQDVPAEAEAPVPGDAA